MEIACHRTSGSKARARVRSPADSLRDQAGCYAPGATHRSLRSHNTTYRRSDQGDYLATEQDYHPAEIRLYATQPVVVIVFDRPLQRAQIRPHSPQFSAVHRGPPAFARCAGTVQAHPSSRAPAAVLHRFIPGRHQGTSLAVTLITTPW